MLDSRGIAASTGVFLPEDVARAFLEQFRWPGGPVCTHCRSVGAYRLHARGSSASPARDGVLKCRACRRQFTVTVGTVFEGSHVPLNKWLLAIAHLCRPGTGVSEDKLDRLLGVSPRTAQYLAHRVRQALAASSRSPVSRNGLSKYPPDRRGPRVSPALLARSPSVPGASGRIIRKAMDGAWHAATQRGAALGQVSFEETLVRMMNRTLRRIPADVDRHPARPAGQPERIVECLDVG